MAWAGNPVSEWKAGRAYEEGDYENASRIYEKILEGNPEDGRGHFNLGDSYYRQQKFDRAEKKFLEALNSTQPQIRLEALYNLGNTSYRQNRLEEAVSYYDKALQINPNHENARLNRDFVLKKLEEQKKQEKQNQEDNQDEQNKEEQAKDKKENGQEKQQQEGDEGKSEEQKQEAKQEPEKQKEEEKQPQEEQTGGDQQQQQGQKKEAEPGQNLSLKEAEQLLEAVDDDPKKAMRDILIRDAEKKGIKPGGKNW